MKKYDDRDRNSILEYARKAQGVKISDMCTDAKVINPKDKGAVGNLIQESYFGIPRNSSSEPDFEKAGIELKAFGYWEDEEKPKADQRLALSKIDFMEFEKEVPFEQSHLYHKCKCMLMMAYLLKLGQKRIDSEIRYVRLYELDKIVSRDWKQIVNDYYTIMGKIHDGKASELSEGDTELLGAARTGDKNSKLEKAPKDDMALPRRFALKQSYVTYLLKEYIVPGNEFNKKVKCSTKGFHIKIPRGKTFEQWLNVIDGKYVGKTAVKLSRLKKIKKITGPISFTDKNAYSRIGLAMLGTTSNKDSYLQKTNTVVKSVRIQKNGKIKEKWSFPNFGVEDIVDQEWEESEIFMYLSEQRILMQIFVEEENGYVYKGHLFLKFTPEELDEYVKQTWESFKKKVIEGISFELELRGKGFEICSDVQGKTSGQIGLIKLHARDITYDIDRKHIHGDSREAEKILDDNTVNGRFVWKPQNRDKYGCKILNGDVITKQSFFFFFDFVLKYIRDKKPEIFSNIGEC